VGYHICEPPGIIRKINYYIARADLVHPSTNALGFLKKFKNNTSAFHKNIKFIL
jgi:hypothetical protein